MSTIAATMPVAGGELVTAPERIDAMVRELRSGASELAALAAGERAELARQCLGRVAALSDRWEAVGAACKSMPPEDPFAIEELVLGPLMAVRQLQILARALDDRERRGVPAPPGEPFTGPDGRLRVPVFPAQGLMDKMVLTGFSGTSVMAPGVTREALERGQEDRIRQSRRARVTCVLGAGNLTAIGPMDAVERILVEGSAALLKLHPNFADMEPVYEDAFAPLIGRGFLRICQGGAETGAYAAHHPGVDEVHITGSDRAFQAIVWGEGTDGARRRAEGAPRLAKPITGELGNVTPWIVTPGPYTDAELAHQAEHLVGCLINNTAFNCVAPRVIVTWRGWPQRERFMDMVEGILAAIPTRRAWYPGAPERYRDFVGEPSPDIAAGHLPWTLLRDLDPAARPRLVERECFVSASCEIALDASDGAAFVERAAGFCNDRLGGTLSATLIVHPDARSEPRFDAALERAVSDLRYGVVGINQWAGIAYLVMTVPWGGHPAGASLAEPYSGLGWTHDPYLLEGIEKSVFESPLVVTPKPMLFPSNRNPAGIARGLFDLTVEPGPQTLGAVSAEVARA